MVFQLPLTSSNNHHHHHHRLQGGSPFLNDEEDDVVVVAGVGQVERDRPLSSVELPQNAARGGGGDVKEEVGSRIARVTATPQQSITMTAVYYLCNNFEIKTNTNVGHQGSKAVRRVGRVGRVLFLHTRQRSNQSFLRRTLRATISIVLFRLTTRHDEKGK